MSTKTTPSKRATGICRDLLTLRPANLDEKAIRRLVGNRVAKNLSELAAEFGIEATSIRTGWRVQGMPGAAGKWPLADILLWRLKHEAEIASRFRSRDESTDRELERRRLEGESRKIELQVERLSREEDQAVGRLIDRDAAATAVKTAAAVLAERLMRLPTQFSVSLPSNIARDQTTVYERAIRRELVAFSETTGQAILESSGATNGHR